MGSKSKYTAELLAPIVASSSSLSDVIRKLGLAVNGGNHRYISARVRHAGLDTSHFGGKLRKRIDHIPVAVLAPLVAESSSFAEVLSKLDMPTEGRAYCELKRRVDTVGLDTTHFTGSNWNKGETAATHPSIAQYVKRKTRPDEEVFVENSPDIKGESLRRRLLAMGWQYCCALCGISQWRGEALRLEVDHKNGINNDNRLENLRFLCPNCHSQTETYCRAQRAQPSRACEPRAHYSCYTSPRTRACWNR